MENYNKYIKYKKKYNELKNNGVLNYIKQKNDITDTQASIPIDFNRIKQIFKKFSDFTNWLLHQDPERIDITRYNALRYIIEQEVNTEGTFNYNDFNSSENYKKTSVEFAKQQIKNDKEGWMVFKRITQVGFLWDKFVDAASIEIDIFINQIKILDNTVIKQEFYILLNKINKMIVEFRNNKIYIKS